MLDQDDLEPSPQADVPQPARPLVPERPPLVAPRSSHALGPLCPRCGGQRCSRTRRQGFLQTLILPRFGFFPWECGQCRNVFTFKSRGKLKRRRSSIPSSPRGPLPSA